MDVIKAAAKNPLLTAVGVFAVGAVVLLLLRKPTVVQDNGMGAFYAAQAASANSGNQVLAVERQVAGATAIAKIAADRDVAIRTNTNATSAELADIAGRYSVQVNTVQTQRDLSLAEMAKEVSLVQERTRVEAQNKAYWQGVGQNALQGQSLPYLLQAILNGGDSARAAAQVMSEQIKYSSQYYAAHGGA